MTLATTRTRPAKLTIWRPFLVLVLREVTRLWKEKLGFSTRIATISLATVFVFDFIMPQLGNRGGGVASGYATILAPGLVAVTTCNQALTATLMSLVHDFGPLRRIDQTLMAPLPIPLLAVVRIIGGTLHGVFAAGIVLPIVTFVHAPGAPPAIDLGRWPLLLCTVVVAGLLFSALGILVGTSVNPAKAATLLPYGLPLMIMLGCVYYPWSALNVIPWLQYAVLVNPVIYVTEATRATLAPQSEHLPELVLIWVLGAGALLAMALGTARFTASTRR